MPIKIPDNLPARDILKAERIDVMDESTAIRQDIRPLKILLFNLMPDKITTETQIARVLGASPLQIELTLLRTETYVGKNTAEMHLKAFYKTFDDIKDDCFDGIIVTGAPVEHIHFEDVDYWPEMTKIMDWSTRHCFGRFYICWAAQAALYHFHGINKILENKKYFGVYPHQRTNFVHPLTKGFDDNVNMPVSRYTKIDEVGLLRNDKLNLLLSSKVSGPALVVHDEGNAVFMFNHLEYDRETLGDEYKRDKSRGLDTDIPINYFYNNNPDETPNMNWRAHRNLLFLNWINIIYQSTPFDLQSMGDLA